MFQVHLELTQMYHLCMVYCYALLLLQMTLDNNAIEAGLGHFIKTKKQADFVGKHALQEMKSRDGGLPRKLVFMMVDTDNVDPEGNETIWNQHKVIEVFFLNSGRGQTGKKIVDPKMVTHFSINLGLIA